MNSQKITNLATPTLSTDLVTKQYIDDLIQVNNGTVEYVVNSTNTDSKLTAGSTEMTNNLTPLNMNSQIITGLANATTGTDAISRDFADSRYYASTTALNSLTSPTSSVAFNNKKITSLGDATLSTDALNR